MVPGRPLWGAHSIDGAPPQRRVPGGGINPLISSPSPTECGKPVIQSPRIVGGQPASNGSWPWQVSILQDNRFICGGSLIADQWVLSAAHSINQYKVLLGAYQLLNLINTVVVSGVRQIILHPDYTNSIDSSGDIALLKLNTPVQFTNFILPICLPASSVRFSPNADCWVTGWGDIQTKGEELNLPPPLTLQELKVPLISRTICNYLYNHFPVIDLPRNPIKLDMICAGSVEGGKDSCQGDSGGPLVCNLPEGWTQAGIVSWGFGCAQPGHPGVYTFVPFYADWIQKTMNGGLQSAPLATLLLLPLALTLL
uniref:Peptidase S1 domain-containing protein n=1 Tax=Varanus komodoensis TaxID=61221 RepID=A0A8D2IZF8_VARKO